MSDIDQTIISRLVNIKGSYQHALLLLENPTPLDGAIALVLMDNVLEAVFKLVLDEIGSEVSGNLNFPKLLDKVLQANVLRELKNHKLSLLVLRKARNGFQHDGIIADLTTVLREYRPLTEYVLKLICEQSLGLRWEDVSLSLLIKNETIKNLHRKAERAYVQGDYITATAYLIYTFEAVKTVAREHIFGSGLSLHRFKMKSRGNREKDLVQYLTTLDEEIEVFKLGLS